MEIFFHIIGMCPDAHSHFDFFDIIAAWQSALFQASRLSIYFAKIKIAVFAFLK